MRERGILFSGEMVRAILAGEKTQTRRIVAEAAADPATTSLRWAVDEETVPRGRYTGWVRQCGAPFLLPLNCPYGVAGDRLWVREAWRTYASLDHLRPGAIRSGAGVQYECGGSNVPDASTLHGMGRLRPGMFMPRWASRLTLEIIAVRVERLQDITEEAAVAEGCAGFKRGPDGLWHGRCQTPRQLFMGLWDSINGQRAGCAWADNPWVWAVTFRVIAGGDR